MSAGVGEDAVLGDEGGEVPLIASIPVDFRWLEPATPLNALCVLRIDQHWIPDVQQGWEPLFVFDFADRRLSKIRNCKGLKFLQIPPRSLADLMRWTTSRASSFFLAS